VCAVRREGLVHCGFAIERIRRFVWRKQSIDQPREVGQDEFAELLRGSEALAQRKARFADAILKRVELCASVPRRRLGRKFSPQGGRCRRITEIEKSVIRHCGIVEHAADHLDFGERMAAVIR
jgi:hypothetical protein